MAKRKMRITGPSGAPRKGAIIGPGVIPKIGKPRTLKGFKLPSKAPKGFPIILNQRMASRGKQSRVFQVPAGKKKKSGGFR